MGHVRTGPLPQTRRWRQIVALVHAGAGTAQVANATLAAAPKDVRAEFARLATAKQFGAFARDFFARFTSKCLGYFLSKTLPEQVGEGQRFRTLAQEGEFAGALDHHCREAARRVEEFAGD